MMTRIAKVGALALGLLVTSCSGDVDGTGLPAPGGLEPMPTLTSIEIAPQNPVLYLSASAPGEQDFTALGHFSDGSVADLTTTVGWTVEQPLGSFSPAAHLVTATVRGGQTRIHATSGNVDASTMVTVIVRDQHVVAGAPADANSRFTGAADPAQVPTIVYPPAGVMLPPNLGTLDFQWQPQGGTDLYDLHFTSPYLDLHVYTSNSRYTPTAQEWLWLAETHRGGELSYTVRATHSVGGGVGQSAARSMRFAEADVRGGLYYWSATSPNVGIWRFDFGATAGTAEEYLGETDRNPNGGHCVGCHSISRDGTRIAVTNNGSDGWLSILDVATRSSVLPEAVGQLESNFTAFHPDGSRFLANLEGALGLHDATTGALLGEVPTLGEASQPDWSADGQQVVFVRKGQTSSDILTMNGSIEVINYNGGAWGAPRMLVAAQTQDENNYYPQFSPDGRWVVYNHAPSGASYNNMNAEIWIVPVDGSRATVKLAAAHDQPAMTDTWPRWSPFVTSSEEGSLMWVTVSSRRAYGLDLAAGSRAQLWMFAFDSRRAQSGDGSFPAFWLPFQNKETANHNAQWTTRVVPVGQAP
jgi:hypothetical protein